MDNAQTALFVGLGGVLATAFAGIMPSVFSHRLEKSRLKESRDEHSWQRRQAEIKRHLELSDRALDTLVEFLGYADQLSRGHDVVIAHHARSSRLRAVAELIKFSQIASAEVNEAIKGFLQSSNETLEISDSVRKGRRVLEVMMAEVAKSSVTPSENSRDRFGRTTNVV